MYQWLADEIALIQTKHFHKTSPSRDLAGIQREWPRLPAGYQEFLARFGESLLFREIGRNNWEAKLLGAPDLITHKKTGRKLQHLGRFGDDDLYFDEDRLEAGREVPIMTGARGALRQTELPFAEWLEARAARCRKRYGKRGWQQALNGPPPFNEQERAVIEARRQFEWRIVGISDDKCIQFQVTNRSKITLRGLSVDVRGPNLVGGTSLPVASIGPGETKIVAVDCYKDLVDPAETQITIPVEPEPESRGEYWELRMLAEGS